MSEAEVQLTGDSQEVSAKIGKDGEPRVVKYTFGNTLQELINNFGDEVVFNNAKGNLVIALQAFMRSHMRPDEHGNVLTDGQLQEKVDQWKPGTRARGKTAVERAIEALSKLPDDQKAAILEQLMGGEED